jgi:hypothetical protein
MRHPLLRLMAVLLALVQTSCASMNLVPAQHSMPAARASLLPEYRIFYDTLQDYGDWTLIEPFGFVFRPRATIANWQPYGDGFWVPTDLYGWVWLSSEPFGWATYHYGQWFYDSFQGWCWVPGVDWAPAWVDWRVTESSVGWAPLSPRGTPQLSAYHFVPASELGSTDLKEHALTGSELSSALDRAESVVNVGQSEGLRFNRGPSIEWVERRTGPLTRARIEDLIPSTPLASRPWSGGPRANETPAQTSPAPDSVAAVQRAAERAASEARTMIKSNGRVPQQLRMVRPMGVPETKEQVAPPAPARKALHRPAPAGAKRDTTR